MRTYVHPPLCPRVCVYFWDKELCKHEFTNRREHYCPGPRAWASYPSGTSLAQSFLLVTLQVTSTSMRYDRYDTSLYVWTRLRLSSCLDTQRHRANRPRAFHYGSPDEIWPKENFPSPPSTRAFHSRLFTSDLSIGSVLSGKSFPTPRFEKKENKTKRRKQKMLQTIDKNEQQRVISHPPNFLQHIFRVHNARAENHGTEAFSISVRRWFVVYCRVKRPRSRLLCIRSTRGRPSTRRQKKKKNKKRKKIKKKEKKERVSPPFELVGKLAEYCETKAIYRAMLNFAV